MCDERERRWFCPRCRLWLNSQQVSRGIHELFELRGAVAWPVRHVVLTEDEARALFANEGAPDGDA